MFKSDIKEKASNALNKAQDMSEEAKKSGKDWLQYVMDHPLQSLLFGAAIGLAIKGMIKK